MIGRVVLLCLLCTLCYANSIDVVKGLIARTLPNHQDLFQLSTLNTTTDTFEIETVQASTKRGYQIKLSGNNGVSIASALHHYLKYFCSCQISWEAVQLNIPEPAPKVSKISLATPHDYRYYMNTCTHGYSAVWWNWDRWEREIDWMALHGINMPLMFTGQEKIIAEVYRELKVPTTDYFTGPAFLPWNRMGNVNGHAGPLPDSWMNQQFELALKILKREREYGMKPVLPAFNGYVPPQLKTVYPSSKITQLAPWAGFVGTFHLSHEDPLFQQIGVSYAKKVVEAFGTDHLFNVDPFNEEVPPSSDPTYLAGVSKALYGPLVAADPQAIWVMQGWFLSFESSFWGPEQTKAVFNAIPSDRLIILDLFAEEYPMWNVTKTFYNHQFIWNLLHNFGERPGMFGGLNETYRKLTAAMQGGGKLFRGMGLTMEGIHQNPVVYDYATDMIWKNQGSDLSWWISQYIKRRYERVEDSVASAWTILLNSIYNLDSNNGGSPQILGFRPSTGAWGPPNYNATMFIQAWDLVIKNADSYKNSATYQYDLVDITSQVLNLHALAAHNAVVYAYNTKNYTEYTRQRDLLKEIIADVDLILGSNENFLLGNWIATARSWGTTDSEKAFLERNARLQITSWGPAGGTLTQYAYKMWASLVSDFYAARFQIWFDELDVAFDTKKPFDQDKYTKRSLALEAAWVEQTNQYPVTPSGDTIAIAQKIHSKYAELLYWV